MQSEIVILAAPRRRGGRPSYAGAAVGSLPVARAGGCSRPSRPGRRGGPRWRPSAAGPAPVGRPLAARSVGSRWFFLKVGATLFGSGYVLVSYLQTRARRPAGHVADPAATGRRRRRRAGHAGAAADDGHVHRVRPRPRRSSARLAAASPARLAATAAIFLPSFVLVAAFGRVLPAAARASRGPAARSTA